MAKSDHSRIQRNVNKRTHAERVTRASVRSSLARGEWDDLATRMPTRALRTTMSVD